MKAKHISFTTFNLYNLNEPGLPIYTNKDGWSAAQYAKKIEWTRFMLKVAKADVFGFQELWHADSLTNVFAGSGLENEYELLVPPGHAGQKIVCAAAVRKDMLQPGWEWITDFPDSFKLASRGEDPQTPAISVELRQFSRPVLHLRLRPRTDQPEIHVYVCHFKSKGPTRIDAEPWYRADRDRYQPHRTAIGAAISTIRRTAEATAMRLLVTEAAKGTDTPVVVLGDLNDGHNSNTLDILTEQPQYLSALSRGGGDAALYSGQTLQEYRSTRDVYYTHIWQGIHGSLDHILVSEQFYDNSRKRVWAFDGLEVYNDHLNVDSHKLDDGAGDHGIVRTRFAYKPFSGGV